jgi:hypothetical protein
MIVYALHCECGHEFDECFDNMADYDTKRDSLACPSCGGGKVRKAIMAPSVGKAKSAPAMPSCANSGCSNAMCPMSQMMG